MKRGEFERGRKVKGAKDGGSAAAPALSPTRHLTVVAAAEQHTWMDGCEVELFEMMECEGKEMRKGRFEGGLARGRLRRRRLEPR